MGMGMGWGMCHHAIERGRKDYGDGDGVGRGMCYNSLRGIYEQHKKVATHDSDETSTQTIVYSSRLRDRIFE